MHWGRHSSSEQQLEFSIISNLCDLAGEETATYDASFEVFASKTFGSLMREMNKHDFMRPMATELADVRGKRDFFIHKFLFHRYGGELTTDLEYEDLVKDAVNLGSFFRALGGNFENL